jgi:hypothetical protein
MESASNRMGTEGVYVFRITINGEFSELELRTKKK